MELIYAQFDGEEDRKAYEAETFRCTEQIFAAFANNDSPAEVGKILPIVQMLRKAYVNISRTLDELTEVDEQFSELNRMLAQCQETIDRVMHKVIACMKEKASPSFLKILNAMSVPEEIMYIRADREVPVAEFQEKLKQARMSIVELQTQNKSADMREPLRIALQEFDIAVAIATSDKFKTREQVLVRLARQ